MTMPSTYGPRGMALTTRFEGFRSHAYQDSGGVWTVGFGHTGKDIVAGSVVTMADALLLLHGDLSASVASVQQAVKVPLNQHQFDALVDFAFNLGRASLLRSTLLAKLNQGDYPCAAGCFGQWVFCDGKRLDDLVNRRAAETALFREPV